jgi:hypothetical protein
MDEMSGDSRKVDSKVLDQVGFRSKEQVFRRIYVVPYGEREAWSRLQKAIQLPSSCLD